MSKKTSRKQINKIADKLVERDRQIDEIAKRLTRQDDKAVSGAFKKEGGNHEIT